MFIPLPEHVQQNAVNNIENLGNVCLADVADARIEAIHARI
jgi:hypothetical protein